MPDLIKRFAEWCAALIEFVGLTIITALALYALGYCAVMLMKRADGSTIFRETRHRLIRGILLGLEFLVAADIIHTVAVELTVTSVSVLAIIVLIRTFLSFALQVEMTGQWPWQQHSPN